MPIPKKGDVYKSQREQLGSFGDFDDGIGHDGWFACGQKRNKVFTPRETRKFGDVGTHRMRPSAYVCRFSHSGDVVDGVGDEGGGHYKSVIIN